MSRAEDCEERVLHLLQCSAAECCAWRALGMSCEVFRPAGVFLKAKAVMVRVANWTLSDSRDFLHDRVGLLVPVFVVLAGKCEWQWERKFRVTFGFRGMYCFLAFTVI